MPPIVKKPAAKKKPVVKRTSRPAIRKSAAGPKVGRAGKPAARPAAGTPRQPIRTAKSVVHGPPEWPSVAGKTNQDIINVVYAAAEELSTPPWTLMAKAKLEHLVDARSAPYAGPGIADLPNLTPEERALIGKTLARYVRPKK